MCGATRFSSRRSTGSNARTSASGSRSSSLSRGQRPDAWRTRIPRFTPCRRASLEQANTRSRAMIATGSS
ncbi:hypothetical protein [Streptomyces sp. T21Q-yed]|uniref:hypothetical protein n=1 Tax=Streptomyces sp. T21Q-yed TaxID=3018441 RepID=UPI0023DF3CEA|nr:hypothetical protein [Streptomyces sp. T21Q-yed]MDF3149835.1 hypothetical protein [Streptomyces sp. T21Q-yed]